MRKALLDFCVSVAGSQVAGRVNTHWVGMFASATEMLLVMVLGPLEEPELRWKEGTLHASTFDVEANLWFLARRPVPLHVLKGKLNDYTA